MLRELTIYVFHLGLRFYLVSHIQWLTTKDVRYQIETETVYEMEGGLGGPLYTALKGYLGH